MAGSFRSIFRNSEESSLKPPENEKMLMRVLEPRILLDAAALETAMDAMGQSAHAQFADDFVNQLQSDPANAESSATQFIEDAPSIDNLPDDDADQSDIEEVDGLSARRTDREIVFIDSNVDGIEELISSLEPGVTIHMLDGDSDGIQQMADILSGSDSYDAVHIFSHGSSGSLQLGDSVLNAASIRGQHAEALQQIGTALGEDGDILIYGCNFGEGDTGQKAAGLLAHATGADIAASDDLTGSESLSGDWDLEIQSGDIQTTSFSLPDWQGILEGFELQPTAQPVIGHLDNGVVGTANTTATWVDAVTFDPGGGNPVQTFDIRATLVGLTDNVSATFETVASGDGSMDDFRVVMTNIGDVVGNEGGQDVLAAGSASVSWGIYESGTETLAPPNIINLVFKDIEGLAGQPDTRETVAVISDEIVSYTVNTGTDLDISSGPNGLTAVGTQPGTNAVGSQLGLTWASANQFIVTYTSHTLLTNFDMDGDAGLAAFPTPVTTPTQSLDVNGTAAGDDYTTVYVNGARMLTDTDVALSIVDVNMSIQDFDSDFLTSATVTLTNSHPGDQINFDSALLNKLGITATYTDSGSDIVVQLDGFVLISNYETALQSLTYSNNNPDATFNRVDNRIFNFEISDGVVTTTGVTTTVAFGTAGNAPVAGTNTYVEDEDTTIVASIANGLISDDSDPQGNTLTVVGGLDSDNVVIPIGVTHTTPTGAALTINADGSFTYIPATNYSGNETISYTVSDGTFTSTSFATFDIQPVVDNVTLTVTQLDSTSDEDTTSEVIDVSVFSADTSENQSVVALDIPPGVIITDGVTSFEANADETEVDITTWNRSAIRILPVQNSDVDVTITFLTTNFEVDGSVSFDSQSVVFEIDAVADVPILIVEQAFGDIDGDVLLADTISVQLFDIDGSEEITEIRISNIPVGGQILVNSVAQPIVGGEASVGPLDIANLVFRPPQTGMDAIYNMNVSAITTEVSPENGVATSTAIRANVGLLVELDNDNNPVVAVDDQASTFAGETVNIDVLENDFIPDGTPLVTEVNGIAIDIGSPVTLPGGQGTVSLSPFGFLIFEASTTFAGEIQFSYTVQDVDLSTDTGTVTVLVLPRWALSSDPTAIEGSDSRFTLTIEGGVAQGDTITADLTLFEGTTDAGDHESLTDAINNSIARYGQNDFSFDGTTLSYTAPSLNYTSQYEPIGPGFTDISPVGDALSVGDEGISLRSLGFDFDFYGDTFSEAYISANGYLTFGSPGVGAANQSLDGSALSGRPIIAPFWDDLNTTAGNVYVETVGTEPGQRQFIVQWDDVQNNSDGSGTGSFQVILSEGSGEIRFNYQDVIFDGVGDEGAGATIGLQSSDGLGDEFAMNTGASVVDGASVLFSRADATGGELLIDLAIIDDPNFEDVEDFSIQISNSVNSSIGTNSATVAIDVSDNTAPVTADDAMTTNETGTTSINVITNPAGLDSDAEGHTLRVAEIAGVTINQGTAISLPSGATVGVNLDGTFVYNPNGAFAHLAAGALGVDTFTYRVMDEFGALSTVPATVTVTIIGENQTAFVDLDDAGATSTTTNTVQYEPTDVALNVAATDASILDPDDSTFVSMNISLAGFVQPGNEKLAVGTAELLYGTLQTTTVTVGTTTFHVDYFGVDSITVTRDGGGEMPRDDLEAFIHAMTYENDSSDDTRGTRTITFNIDDGDGVGASTNSEVFVVGNNIAPIAVDDGDPTPYVTAEETGILITLNELLVNDTDADLDVLSIVAVDGGANGAAVLDGFGNVVYTPGQDFVGLTSFTYTVDDGAGGQDIGQVFVNVTPVNDAPRIDLNGAGFGSDYAFTYVENDPATPIMGFTGTVIDIDSATMTGITLTVSGAQIDDTFTIGSLPGGISASMVPAEAATGLTSAGSVTIQLTGNATPDDYEDALKAIEFSNPSDNPVGGDRLISMTATDGADTSTPVVTTITVQPVNDAPDTVSDGPFSFDEDTTVTITPIELLGNDSDREGDPLTITSVQGAINGTVLINGAGNIEFTSDPDYFGPALFTYTVDDGNGGVSTETATLTVNSVNDLAVLTLDTGSGDGNYSTGYIENGPGLQVVDPSITLTDVDHTNMASATITLNNGQIGDVLEVGGLPGGITATVVPASPLTSPGTITVTLSNTASVADYVSALQLVTYRSISDAPSIAPRDLSINVNDGIDDSNVGTTTIAITAVNDAPVAVDDNSIAFDEDTTRIILTAELAGNDFDPDEEPFTIVSVQSATNGTVVLNGDGTITFTPVADYFGAASFTYTIDDGNGEQATATVNLTINSVNDVTQIDLDAVALGSDFATAYIENGVGVQVVDASVSIQDVDDVNLESVSVVLTNGQIGDLLEVGGLPAGITATVLPASALIAPGQIMVTLFGTNDLASYETALQAITYRSISEAPSEINRSISITTFDGDDDSNIANTTISVTGVNDDPVVTPDNFFVDEDTPLVVTPSAVLLNDSDPDGDTLSIDSVGGATNGTVSINGSGNIVFTPDVNYSGPASFTYTTIDGNGGTATGTVTVTVNAVNDAPILDLDANTTGAHYVTAYVEDGAAVSVADSTVLISDVDDVDLEGATITLTNGQVGDVLEAGVLPTGITASITPSTALPFAGSITVNLTGVASRADYQLAIEAISYSTQSQAPDVTDRSISISVFDGAANSSSAITTIAVTSVNDAPTTVNDGPFSFDEDTLFTIAPGSLLFNDSDPEGDALSIVSVQGATNGSVIINGSGQIEFTPDVNYSGPASFTYTVDDGNGDTSTSTVDLNVNAVNDAPTLDLNSSDGSGTSFTTTFTEGDAPVGIIDPSVLAGDVDGTSLTTASITLTNGQVGDRINFGTLPAGISGSVSPTGLLIAPGSMVITLTGNASFADYQAALQTITYESQTGNPATVSRTISVTVNDGTTDSVAAISTVDVVSVNDVPIAGDDGVFTLDEDTDFTIVSSALLFNDSDPEGDAISVVSVQSPVNGTVVLAGSGLITFTPDADYSGPASFTYTVRDANGGESIATVNLSVQAINDLTDIDLNVTTSGTGHTTSYVENAAGSQVVDASAVLTDVDSPNLVSATFELSNGQTGDVLEVGALPAGITASVVPSTALIAPGLVTVTLSGSASLADYSTALQAVTFRSISDNPDSRTRSISLIVNDGQDDSAPATSLIAVNIVNDPPVAGPDGVYTFDEDTVLTLPAASLLLNDSDPEGEALTIVSVQAATNGTASIDPGGAVVFVPDTGYFGPASFTYTVRDASGATSTALVSLDILILNDPSIIDLDADGVGSGYAATYVEDAAPINIVDSDITISDEDHTSLLEATINLTNGQVGDVLEIGTLPAGLSVSTVPAVIPPSGLSTPGSISLTISGSAPLADYEAALRAITYRSASQGPDTTDRIIEISTYDGFDPSNLVTSVISVTSVNDAPIAVDDGSPVALAATEDTPFVYNAVAANDSDVENDVLTIVELNGASVSPGGTLTMTEGVVELASNGVTFTFTPASNYFGPVSFDYTLSDGSLTDTATVTIDVVAVNDAPNAVDDGPVVLVEDGSAFINPIALNDSDVENDALSIVSIDGQPIAPLVTVFTPDGEITLGADGQTLEFVPDANFFGTSVIVYEVSDGADSSTANVTFDVTPLDDPITLASPIADVTYNDSEIVNLPVAANFIDPDGDALLYSAVGLPAGLSINSTTGVISGAIDSSASQTGPYSVTVTADDGLSSVVSTTFVMTVNNVVPVADPDETVVVNDGQSVLIGASDYFVDADGDALTFAAVGLPAWLSIDPVSGAISGTVPTNASVFGPIVTTITATDADGAVANIDVTIDPTNVAPIVLSGVADMTLQEGDDVDVNVAALFADGGVDADTLTFTVAGLPDGVTFDALSGMISGQTAPGSSSTAPYIITLTADDGQGGIISQTFTIQITSDLIDDEDNFPVEFADLVEDLNREEEADGSSPVGQIVDGISNLNGIADLIADEGILLSAIAGIDPLYEATGSGSNDGLPEQIDAMDVMAQSTDWLSESGRKGDSNWDVSGTFGYRSLIDDGSEFDDINNDIRKDKMLVEAIRRQGALFIEFKDDFDPARDGEIVRTAFASVGGGALPEWMRVIREGFISANPPADITEVDLQISVVLKGGELITKAVTIDALSGAVIDLEEDEENDAEKADNGDDVDAKPQSFKDDRLRGSVDYDEPAR